MTIELKGVTLDQNSASNWFEGCLGGSPGAAYSKCVIAGNDKLSITQLARLYPNPASDLIHILPRIQDTQVISCRVYDVIGKEVKVVSTNDESHNSIQIAVSGLNSGIYFVQLSGGSYQQSLKFFKR